MTTLFVKSRALFHIACRACRGASAESSEAIVAIVFATVALESFVNEIIDRVNLPPWPDEEPEVGRLRAMAAACDLSSRTAALPTKMQMIYAALTGHSIDRSRQPYQDFDLLLAVRNVIVHDRPERVIHNEAGGRSERPLKVVTRLVARGVMPQLDESEAASDAWVTLADPRVATWAVKTALATAHALAEAFPGSAWKAKLLFGFKSLENCC